MSVRTQRVIRVVLIIVVGAIATPSGASGRSASPHRTLPNLAIFSGKVSQSGATLAGSFVVARTTSQTAGASTATLALKIGNRQRIVERLAVGSFTRLKARKVKVRVGVPAAVAAGRYAIVACADALHKVTERSESDNCRTVGTAHVVAATSKPGTGPVPSPDPGPGVIVASTVPTAPLAYTTDTPQEVTSPSSDYWVDVPDAYDVTNQTPVTLFVWLHGCGGFASGDVYSVSPNDSTQTWITLALGGREGDCWDVDADPSKVLAAIADAKTHFNINPRRVIIGGYSSGGDLTYRTAFYNAGSFAGVLVACSSPFRDTGSTASASIAAASWKINVVHLANTSDDTYPIDGVESEIQQLTDAGFPVAFTQQPGTHDCTDDEIRTYLLPHLNDPWLAPA